MVLLFPKNIWRKKKLKRKISELYLEHILTHFKFQLVINVMQSNTLNQARNIYKKRLRKKITTGKQTSKQTDFQMDKNKKNNHKVLKYELQKCLA